MDKNAEQELKEIRNEQVRNGLFGIPGTLMLTCAAVGLLGDPGSIEWLAFLQNRTLVYLLLAGGLLLGAVQSVSVVNLARREQAIRARLQKQTEAESR